MALPDFFYRWFLLREMTLNDRFDEAYDNLLSNCIKSGITSYRYDTHEGEVLFSNNVYYRFWNSNKYYAWLNTARFQNNSYPTNAILPSGRRNEISFNGGRPSAKTMYRFKEALKKINGQQVQSVFFPETSQADAICDLLTKISKKESMTPPIQQTQKQLKMKFIAKD